MRVLPSMPNRAVLRSRARAGWLFFISAIRLGKEKDRVSRFQMLDSKGGVSHSVLLTSVFGIVSVFRGSSFFSSFFGLVTSARGAFFAGGV